MSRASVLDVPITEKDRLGGLLVDGAMDALLARDGFRRALAVPDPNAGPNASHFPPATLRRCAPGRPVAQTADDLLQGVVVVKERKDGFGSGFLVSPDGLVIVLQEHPPESLRQKVERAVRLCPRQAITLIEEE